MTPFQTDRKENREKELPFTEKMTCKGHTEHEDLVGLVFTHRPGRWDAGVYCEIYDENKLIEQWGSTRPLREVQETALLERLKEIDLKRKGA